MEDDLDELLDEVEKKFCRNISVSYDKAASPNKEIKSGKDSDGRRNVGCGQKTKSITEDIDALLEEFKEEEQKNIPPTKLSIGDQIHCQHGGRKCCPVYLGGSALAKGIGTATSKRSCDQLRCTSCDFRIVMFDDREWDSSCDYLFLRNNMPDHKKLAAKLRKKNGVRAYACQCSWFTVSDAIDVSVQPHLKWACARHLD
nr:cilia- and flagella-associated protein 418-like [Nerophis lumbriciformis]